ncbi:MAG: hypothetical protein ACLFVQ_07280 [Chitinispirillaceae bacterium]
MLCLFVGHGSALEDRYEHIVGKHNIGAAAGFITGNGLAYRYWFENGFGAQVTFAPYYKRDESYKDLWLNVGLSGYRILNQGDQMNLFCYAGSNLIYEKSEYYDTYYEYEYESEYQYNDYYYNDSESMNLSGGAGFGIDFHFWKISLNLMVGLRGTTDFKERREVGFSTEGAAFYSF